MSEKTSRLEIDAPARISALIACLETLREFGDAWNLEREVVDRARIIVEELFLNTIKYGYAGECDRPVRVSLDADPPVTLIYEDDAPPFDPTAWTRRGDRRPTADSPRQGEAGLDLLFGLAARVDYQPREPGNRLVVRMTRESGGERSESSAKSTAVVLGSLSTAGRLG